MSRIAEAEEREHFEMLLEIDYKTYQQSRRLQIQDSSVLVDSVYLVLSDAVNVRTIAAHYSIEQVDSMITALTYFRDRAIERRNDETETEPTWEDAD